MWSIGSPEGSNNGTNSPREHRESRDSRKSTGDALSISRVQGNETQRGTSASKQMNNVPNGRPQPMNIPRNVPCGQAQSKNTPTDIPRNVPSGQPQSKNTPSDKPRNVPSGQPQSKNTSLNGGVRPNGALTKGNPSSRGTPMQGNQKRSIMGVNNQIKTMHTPSASMLNDQGNAKRLKQNADNLLSYDELEKIVDKVLQKNPDPVRKFVRGQHPSFSHCYLAGMVSNACDNKCNVNMLDKMLWSKLEKEKFVANKKVDVQNYMATNGGS